MSFFCTLTQLLPLPGGIRVADLRCRLSGIHQQTVCRLPAFDTHPNLIVLLIALPIIRYSPANRVSSSCIRHTPPHSHFTRWLVCRLPVFDTTPNLLYLPTPTKRQFNRSLLCSFSRLFFSLEHFLRFVELVSLIFFSFDLISFIFRAYQLAFLNFVFSLHSLSVFFSLVNVKATLCHCHLNLVNLIAFRDCDSYFTNSLVY